MGNKALDDLISRMGDLPALPAVVAEVLRITEDPNSAMAEVTQVIQSDPALTAKILRLSNSSYYGMRQQVGTLKLALVILGVREVRNIVLGISVFETLKGKSGDLAVAQDIWIDSLKTAGIAKGLASYLGLGFQGEEFITGLLADIGKMLLLRHLKQEYAKIFQQFRDDPTRLVMAEMLKVGYSHADASTALAVQWNLPKTLSDALWCQYRNPERPLKQAKDPKLAAVVRVAKMAALDDFEQDEGHRSLDDLEAWEILDGAKLPIPSEARKSVVEGLKQQALADAPPLL